MNLPCFYTATIAAAGEYLVLDEESSRHIVQVLRMNKGLQVQLTDGRGNLLTAEIVTDLKRSVEVQVLSTISHPPPVAKMSIGISLVKNTSRFEWFLEKACEIGVFEIVPLICERTERSQFRHDRMKNIVISSMLQSRQVWLPLLHEPMRFKDTLARFTPAQRFIAHCMEEERHSLARVADVHADAVVLIGPEGDFTAQEIELALQVGYIPVLLGETRLRTETAGVVAATLLKNGR